MKISDEIRYQFIGYFLFLMLVSACSDLSRQKKSAQNNIKNADTAINKPPGSFSDTITINFPAAVFYNPDSLQLERIKSILKKMEFESIVHECYYQMRNARMSLKNYWPQIRIIEASKARYLLFIKSDKSKIYIDLDTKNDICGLFLFNQVKNPLLADMPNIDTELELYFRK